MVYGESISYVCLRLKFLMIIVDEEIDGKKSQIERVRENRVRWRVERLR